MRCGRWGRLSKVSSEADRLKRVPAGLRYISTNERLIETLVGGYDFMLLPSPLCGIALRELLLPIAIVVAIGIRGS